MAVPRAPDSALTLTQDGTGLLHTLRRDRDAALAARDGLTADRDRLHAQVASTQAALDRLQHQMRRHALAQADLSAERDELKTQAAAQGLLVAALERQMDAAKEEAHALLKAQIEAQTEARLATETAKENVQEAKATLERLGKDYEALKGALAQATARRDALHADVSRLEQALAAAQSDSQAQQALLATASAQLVAFQTKHTEVAGQLEKAVEQIAVLEAQARLNAERAAELERETGRLHAQGQQLDAALRDANAAASTEQARLAGELASLHAIVASLTDQRNQAMNRVADVERECGRLGAESLRLEAALRTAQASEAATAAAQATASTERARLAGELASLSAIVASLTHQRDQAMNRVADVERECGRLGAETLRLEAEKRELDLRLSEANAKVTELASQAADRAQLAPIYDPNRAPLRHYFIACSLGRTASQWFVKLLNRHPEVLATHAFDLSPEKRVAPRSVGGEMLESFEAQAAVHQKVKTADDAFDIFETDAFKVFGNVHGLDCLEPFEHGATFKRRYYCCYHTRHPIPRIRSIVERWQYEIGLDKRRLALFRSQYEGLAARAPQLLAAAVGKSDDSWEWLELLAIDYLLSNETKYLKSKVPIILYERLVTEREYLAWHLAHITGGAVEIETAFVEEAIKSLPVDRRQHDEGDARRALASWGRAPRHFYRAMLEQLDTALEYDRLGYQVIH